MDKELKIAARKQFFKYFRFWLILIAFLACVCIVLMVKRSLEKESGSEYAGRTNNQCSTRRVFDQADVLTDSEEQKLAELIAEREQQYAFDIVVVTIRENVEAKGNWNTVMMNLADDFYDQGNYGYDKVHGDGILLLDNWYRDESGSQAGTWLSTCGNVYEKFSTNDIDRVMTRVDNLIDQSPYRAYTSAIEMACSIYGSYKTGGWTPRYIPVWVILIGPALIALIYAMTKLHQEPAKDTTTLLQYVDGEKVDFNVNRDTFIRKSVSYVKIETSSGSSGGGGHGGGHVSSGGVSHGGGGHRR